MKILIVDDSRVMRQIICRTLRQAGYGGHELVEAANGREGLLAVRRHEPDLVLSDWNMPEMDGLELLGVLRAQGLDVPFGLVTAERSPEVASLAEAAGAVFVIPKPVTAESLRDKLAQCWDAPPVSDPVPVLTVSVPAPMEVRRLLEDLLGRVVDVAPAPPWSPVRPEEGTLAIFVDDSTTIRAVAVCDVELSAHAGASVGLLPALQARRAISDNALPPMLQENLHEVLDIVSALYNLEGAPHLRLYAVHHVGGDVTPELLSLGGVLGQRLDLTVAISGYGSGRLGLVTVA